MRRITFGLFGPFGLLMLGLAACSPSHEVITTCEDAAGMHAVCGLQNPEDFAVVAGGDALIVSEMGSMTDSGRRGSLAIFDRASEAHLAVYPVERESRAPEPGWGEPTCPGEVGAAFNPHGIDLARRPDGRLQLLVVNHGARESVEVFEVIESHGAVGVEWRGCVPGEELFLNDVVHLPGHPDGGFLATHMMSGNFIWGYLRSRLGMDTGAVYQWDLVDGWTLVPGTESPFPNGIELSADGRDVYIACYGGSEVRRISRETGERLASRDVPSPDNLSRARDGRLLVASHQGSQADLRQCLELQEGTCPMRFEILALDAETLEGEAIVTHEGPPMGGATIAVDLGDELILGAFASDRLVRVPR